MSGASGASGARPQITCISDALRDDILRGVLREGDRIPTQTELAARHQVHPITVRRAVEVLVAEKLLSLAPGHGHRVQLSPAVASLHGVLGALDAKRFPNPQDMRVVADLVLGLWQDRRHPYIGCPVGQPQ